MTRMKHCSSFHYLRGKRLSFEGRPYLAKVYASNRRRIVLRCSRQVEKTTFICNLVIHTAVTYPGVRIIVVFPRQEQAGVFAKSRLIPMIQESPAISRILLGPKGRPPKLKHMRFANKSEVYIRAAYLNADAARGIDGDFLFVDEYQDISPGALPVLEESLSHSEHRRVILTGTPKSIDNHLEGAFNQSTANEWRVNCECGHCVFLDEEVLGPHGPVCPECRAAIRPASGLWVPRNPDSHWGDGFSLNHLATPWLNYEELLSRRDTYDPVMFRNECMGLPTFLGDHVVTREEVEACCEPRAMAQTLDDVPRDMHPQMLAGIDWGGGGVSATVLSIGFIRNDHLHVVYLEKYRSSEQPDRILAQIAECCRRFNVRLIAADGNGNGSVYNPMLLTELPQLPRLYAINYTASDQPPQQHMGRLWRWSVSRTSSLGLVFTRIKKRILLFPRQEDCQSFLPEIYCEVAEYCNNDRSIRFTHPETQPDDTLHSLNYLAVLARYVYVRQIAYS